MGSLLRVTLFFATAFLGSQASATSAATSSQTFKDTLDRSGTPTAHRMFDSYRNQRFNPMFDAGAWHGFLLPEQSKDFGAFTGPMVIMEEYGVYIARKLEQLAIKNLTNGKSYDFSLAKSERFSLPSQPGQCEHEFHLQHWPLRHLRSGRNQAIRQPGLSSSSQCTSQLGVIIVSARIIATAAGQKNQTAK